MPRFCRHSHHIQGDEEVSQRPIRDFQDAVDCRRRHHHRQPHVDEAEHGREELRIAGAGRGGTIGKALDDMCVRMHRTEECAGAALTAHCWLSLLMLMLLALLPVPVSVAAQTIPPGQGGGQRHNMSNA